MHQKPRNRTSSDPFDGTTPIGQPTDDRPPGLDDVFWDAFPPDDETEADPLDERDFWIEPE